MITETSGQSSFFLAFIMLFHAVNPFLDFLTDALAILALKQICTTAQDLYDRPAASDLRWLLMQRTNGGTYEFLQMVRPM
ncbi:hypothetical protein [Ktedonobacter racemifer]|nr:hypothetical protein [Ktedonobacter racemifer]